MKQQVISLNHIMLFILKTVIKGHLFLETPETGRSIQKKNSCKIIRGVSASFKYSQQYCEFILKTSLKQ